MSKNKSKKNASAISAKEEQQAKRVMKILTVALLLIAVIFLVVFSTWG